MTEKNLSRPVTSPQPGPHPDLAKVVARHLASRFQKPIHDASRAAMHAALAAWRARGKNVPLILDSGCGVGESTWRLAQRFPEAFVLGIDQSAHRLQRFWGRHAAPPPDNALCLRADLVDFWRLLAEQGVRLDRHYLLYPNPWPKPEHLKRRWAGHPVFPALLALGGKLECRSNWKIYVEELAAALGLAGQAAAVEPWTPIASALTPFERKYQASGHALWRLCAELAPQGDAAAGSRLASSVFDTTATW